VAEILRGSLPSQHAAGIRVQWAVLAASPEFTAFTKSLYYSLCGVAAPEVAERLEGHRPLYEATCRVTADRLAAAADPADLIVLHDHQAAGLAPFLRDAGHPVLWRMHVGPADDHARARHGWAFLSRYTAAAHASVSSAPDVLPPGLATAPNYVLAPAIDPLSAKNRPLGTAGEVARLAAPATAAVPAAAPLVTQVSRWDRVKDIPGVIRAFADHVDPALDAHLALVGPDTRRDPPAQRVFGECRDLWTRLGAAQRARVHLVQLPTGSRTRHALTVNALQRRSAVIVQNSRAEGFGLTVTEAAWKGRPVVASAVGGLRHQVEDGRTGLLARPGDPGAFGQAVERVLRDPAYGEELGHAARDRVRTRFLPDSHLLGVARVLTRMSAVR
jgi:trehalose synthase